jgi:hypothetical protein
MRSGGGGGVVKYQRPNQLKAPPQTRHGKTTMATTSMIKAP